MRCTSGANEPPPKHWYSPVAVWVQWRSPCDMVHIYGYTRISRRLQQGVLEMDPTSRSCRFSGLMCRRAHIYRNLGVSRTQEAWKDMPECFLGIDVGYSLRRPTTGLCLLTIDSDRFQWQCRNTGTEDSERRESLQELLPAGTNLHAVGIDGPLASGLKTINRYRVAEALLSRGPFQSRCKPGATNSRTGQHLHHHANALAKLVMELRCINSSSASHPSRIHDSAVLEVFPTVFLAVLLNEVEIDVKKKQFGRKKSDGYWELAVRQGSLSRLVQVLAPQRRLTQSFSSIRNHDQRAAFVCALAALCLARNRYVSVGDQEDGNIVLPPKDHWWVDGVSQQKWAWETLKSNLDSLSRTRGSCTNHDIQVIYNGERWLQRPVGQSGFGAFADGHSEGDR